MDLLRFVTAGNVDDGKSTLIGRLLFDSKAILQDQLEAVEKASQQRGDDFVNLALLTDGLRAEREQGITIDVAYRYFSTKKRKFIISDTPGHIQYTRNMVTGASNANLAIIIVDARKGLAEQTFRHSVIASLLKIPHLVICVNKMDLVDYSQEIFDKIREQYEEFSQKLEIQDLTFIPVSALNGENVVDSTAKMPWYNGRTLLQHLEEVYIASDLNQIDFRFPVQTVVRPQSKQIHDYRGYAGKCLSGSIRVGEEVIALPMGFRSRIKSIEMGGIPLQEASAPLSVVIRLEDEIDISRGDCLVKPGNQPSISQDIEAMVCWMDHKPLNPSQQYTLIHTTNFAKCMVKEILYKLDVSTLHRNSNEKSAALNDIVKLKIRSTKPLFYDSYRRNRLTGSFILVDDQTYMTAAAGMIV